MNFNILYLLLPIVMMEIVLLSFVTYVFLQVSGKYYIKFIMIPGAFAVSILSVLIFSALLGYATPSTLPSKFILMGYNIIYENSEKVGIEIWAKSNHTRLFLIPYSKGMEKALDEAGKKGQPGSVTMERNQRSGTEKSNGEGIDKDHDPYKSNLMLPSQIVPKAPDTGQSNEMTVPPSDDDKPDFK